MKKLISSFKKLSAVTKFLPAILLATSVFTPSFAFAGIDIGAVSLPPSVTLTASPEIVEKGENVTLNWFGVTVESCFLDQGIGAVAVSGTMSVKVLSSTTYTITCSGGTSVVTATASVVASGSAVSAFGNPAPVLLGTEYKAATDGFVTVPNYCDTDAYWFTFIQTAPSASGAWTDVQRDGGYYGIGSGFVMPVAKGTYWRIKNDGGGDGGCLPTWTPITPNSGIGAFGALQTKTATTVYQAATDGFAVFPYQCVSAGQYWHDALLVGNSASSLVEVQHQGGEWGKGGGIVMPVQAGKYWSVQGTNGTNCGTTPVYWMPIGSGTASLDTPRAMNANTSYVADTDGFVTSLYACGGKYWNNYLKTSTNGTTWTLAQHAGGYWGEGGGVIYPVKKGVSWRFEGCAGGAGSLTWIPLYGPVKDKSAELSISSCSASPATPIVGSTVTWSSEVTGGNGAYTYSWSGTDNLTGAAASVQKIYSTVGLKTASLSVTDAGGATKTASCSGATVTTASAPTATLSGAPASIILGGTSLLTWGSTNANSCTGSGFSTGGATSGTKLVAPSTDTNYAVTCTNTNTSATASKAVTVTVKQPSASISASAGRAKKGDTITISWNANNVTSCTITGSGIGSNGTKTVTAAADGSITGAQDVVINAQSTYIISCSPSGQSSQSAAVVNLAPDFQEF